MRTIKLCHTCHNEFLQFSLLVQSSADSEAKTKKKNKNPQARVVRAQSHQLNDSLRAAGGLSRHVSGVSTNSFLLQFINTITQLCLYVQMWGVSKSELYFLFLFFSFTNISSGTGKREGIENVQMSI